MKTKILTTVFSLMITSAENIIKKWRKSELGATDAYMQLYKSVQRIDKHI